MFWINGIRHFPRSCGDNLEYMNFEVLEAECGAEALVRLEEKFFTVREFDGRRFFFVPRGSLSGPFISREEAVHEFRKIDTIPIHLQCTRNASTTLSPALRLEPHVFEWKDGMVRSIAQSIMA